MDDDDIWCDDPECFAHDKTATPERILAAPHADAKPCTFHELGGCHGSCVGRYCYANGGNLWTGADESVDARDLLASVADLIRNARCHCHHVDIGVGWQKVAEDPMCPRCTPEGLAGEILAKLEPAIRRQERAEVGEEIALAIHDRFEHFKPEYHQAMIAVAEWCEDEARRHSTQPGEETKP